MSDFIVEAKGVTKVLGRGAAQVYALKDIDLSLRGGELTVLMGPSGSGKTTLLSILGCILTPTSGTVRVCGREAQGANAEVLAKLRRDHVGFVFQSYRLFPTLTASENIQLALDIRGAHGEDARAKSRDALERVGLAHKTASYPHELSGGEQQRVAIARAIVSKPSAIFADEPTAVLDTKNGQAIMSILAEIAKDPAHGVMVVTHDSRMTSFADRVIHIEDGCLVGDERGSAGDAAMQTTASAGRRA
jgi:putative ABC transport system ATP-binding protein